MLRLEDILLSEVGTTEVLPFIDADSISRSAPTAKPFNSFFKELDLLSLSRAAHYVIVKPSVIELKKILDALDNESLKRFLERKVKNVLDQSDRTIINSTLLQLAYGAGDDEMCFEFIPYFERAFGSVESAKEAIRNQLDEKFLERNDEEKKQNAIQDLEIKNKLAKSLETVRIAISNEKFDHGKDANGRWILSDATLKAIETFRTEFDALHPKTIDKGMHYRYQSTLEMYDAYMIMPQQWNYDYKKCALFEDGILVMGLESLPANDGMRCSQGFHYLQNDNPEAFTRSLKMRNNDNHHFYTCLRGDSVAFSLMRGSYINIRFAVPSGRYNGTLTLNPDPRDYAPPLQKLLSTKTERLATLRGKDNIAQNKPS